MFKYFKFRESKIAKCELNKKDTKGNLIMNIVGSNNAKSIEFIGINVS